MVKQESQTEYIKVGLHGHVMAGADPLWRIAYFPQVRCRNLVKVVTDKLIQKDITIYTITDDEYGHYNSNKTRFQQFFEEARILGKTLGKQYQICKLDDHTFTVTKKVGNKDHTVFYLDGQSLTVKEDDKLYEIYTFGDSGFSEFSSFQDAQTQLHDKGLLLDLEHQLAKGHHGAMSEEKLEYLCEDKLVDTVEHNGKITIWNWIPYVTPNKVPIIGKLKEKVIGYTRSRNTIAVEIANKYETAVLFNDDADTIGQIESAYNKVRKDKIDLSSGKTSGETIIRDLNEEIMSGKTDGHPGHTPFVPWPYYIGVGLLLEEILGRKQNIAA